MFEGTEAIISPHLVKPLQHGEDNYDNDDGNHDDGDNNYILLSHQFMTDRYLCF